MTTAKYQREVVAKGLTSVIVKKRTRERLRNIGHKHQTYDEILNELIELWEKSKK